jgi:hypothetical protein
MSDVAVWNKRKWTRSVRFSSLFLRGKAPFLPPFQMDSFWFRFWSRKIRKRKDEEFPKCRIIFVFIFRVLLAETPKTFSASRLTGQIFFKWLLCVTVGTFFLSRRTAVAWKFGRFSVTEVPVGTFLTGQKTKKQKKYSKKRNFLFLFNLVV